MSRIAREFMSQCRLSVPLAVLRNFSALLIALGCVATSARGAEEGEAPAKPDAAAKAIADALSNPAEDPLVRTLLEANPTTPRELLTVVKILVDINRFKLARLMATKFLDSRPTDQDMEQLLERFGTGTLMNWSNNRALAPELGQLVSAVMAGAQKYREDPARLKTLIAALQSPDQRTRQNAVVQISRAHIVAVPLLLQVLADPQRAAEHAAVRTMLVDMASDSIGPLGGALEAADPAFRAQIIDVIGRQRSRQFLLPMIGMSLDPQADPRVGEAARRAVAAIVGKPASVEDARIVLQREIERLLADVVKKSGELTPEGEVWHWDGQAGESVLKSLPEVVISADRAADLARGLLALGTPEQLLGDRAARGFGSNSSKIRRLCVTAILTGAVLDQDMDQPLPRGEGTAHDLAAAEGMEAIDDLLADALVSRNAMAAKAATEILAEIGKPSLLMRFGERPAPLALAARSGDRRVRFAALNTILTLAPEVRFPGASAVEESLAFFAGSGGVPHVLIGHPRSEMAQALAGLAAELGYDADIATNSRQLFARAVGSPDYDFVLLHFLIDRPRIDDLLLELHRDERSRRLPIGIMALPENMKLAQRLADGTPWTLVFEEPATSMIMKYRYEDLMRLTGRHNVPFAERQRQALVALDWIIQLAEKPRSDVYDLKPLVPKVSLAMTVPALKGAAITALANLGTVAGQQAILEVVNQGTQPISIRQGAAEAFWRSVQLHGILLTKSEILRQYDIYNGSARADRAVQKVLASVLDTLERRDDSAEKADRQ